jgi:hypothetical protein
MDSASLIADVSAWQLAEQLGRIFYTVVLPILLVVGLGFLLQRKLGLDMPTLSRLNFYFVVPAMAYFSLVTSKARLSDGLVAVGFSLAVVVVLAAVTQVVAMVRKVPVDLRRAMFMTTLYYNSGNYGLPLQELAFRRMSLASEAQALQVFVMMTQSFLGSTLGVLLASGGQGGGWRKSLGHVLRMPPVWALVAAIVTINVRNALGGAAGPVGEALGPFWTALEYVKGAFYAVALGTLGAQLALVRKAAGGYPVRLSVILRLLVAPAVGLGLVYLFGLRGLNAQVLLISTATPTAVNCMLLCLHFDNHPEYATRAVLYSTLISPLTITGVIFLAQSGLLPGFAL